MVALMLNERLFAKKGEAVPAGIPVRDPAPKRGEGVSSALSFLIQRRGNDDKATPTQPLATAQSASPAPALASPPAPATTPAPVPSSVAMTWHAEVGHAEVGHAEVGHAEEEQADAADYVRAPRLQMAGAGLPPDAPDDDPDWRRVSFRLSTGNHRKLRNLARLWGVSGQSLLQTAVANFLDAAVTGDDPNWRH